LLDAELEAARPAATGVAAVLAVRAVLAVAAVVTVLAVTPDVLLQRLVLVGLRLVGDVGRGRRGRRLVGARGARVDVPARDRDGRVRVDRVLVALADAEGRLLGVCCLDAGLEAARA